MTDVLEFGKWLSRLIAYKIPLENVTNNDDVISNVVQGEGNKASFSIRMADGDTLKVTVEKELKYEQVLGGGFVQAREQTA